MFNKFLNRAPTFFVGVIFFIAVVCFVPLVYIWAVNVIFNMNIDYNVETWAASLVLTGLLSERSVSK